MVCLMLENSNASLCPSTFEASLSQTERLIMHIEDRTKQLYESYLTHQDLHSIAPQLCQRNISWFPKRDITKKTGSMLRRLHKTLEHMDNSLTVIREQQKHLNHENALLHKELKMAQLSVKGLLQNTRCALILQGRVPTSIPPLTRPVDRSTFDVKIEGCQVLWNYSQFISHLSQAFSSRQLEGTGRHSQKRDVDEHAATL
ncbi:leukemia inhibitory factor-like [Paroedura picta]|uniref:leukemia inhibitory factor-like n=1 Tax=Paroedura picta TaxID=143630 RepID=UPI004056458B